MRRYLLHEEGALAEISKRRLAKLRKDMLGRFWATSMYNALFTGSEATRLTPAIINAAAATLTITQAVHAGAWITLNRAGGVAVTLPNATGTGAEYWFLNMTPLSAASHVISRGVGTDKMVGIAGIGKAAGTSTTFQTGATDNTITFNATTTGGLGGDVILLVDVAAGIWFVNIEAFGSGTLATPFSNT